MGEAEEKQAWPVASRLFSDTSEIQYIKKSVNDVARNQKMTPEWREGIDRRRINGGPNLAA